MCGCGTCGNVGVTLRRFTRASSDFFIETRFSSKCVCSKYICSIDFFVRMTLVSNCHLSLVMAFFVRVTFVWNRIVRTTLVQKTFGLKTHVRTAFVPTMLDRRSFWDKCLHKQSGFWVFLIPNIPLNWFKAVYSIIPKIGLITFTNPFLFLEFIHQIIFQYVILALKSEHLFLHGFMANSYTWLKSRKN